MKESKDTLNVPLQPDQQKVEQAVREIYSVDGYWNHTLFHEAMDGKEIIELRNTILPSKKNNLLTEE